MRKKLDTRFPAARIKKIMQADEDVGKIAMAVPLLVSKALELFLQDLCDRTYEITLRRGAKTVNSFHLKQCVQSFNVFDFLREIVSKVPDLGGSDAAGEDRSAAKRRKISDDEEHDSDDEMKRGRSLQLEWALHGNDQGITLLFCIHWYMGFNFSSAVVAMIVFSLVLQIMFGYWKMLLCGCIATFLPSKVHIRATGGLYLQRIVEKQDAEYCR